MIQNPKIILIVGEGRSGSTLFERVLGQHPKIFPAGELIHIWERGFLENQLCSCGKPFSECEVWQKISYKFYDLLGETINPEEILFMLKSSARIRYFLLKRRKRSIEHKLAYIYAKLYKAIHLVSKAEYIIDSSKHPVYALILADYLNLPIYIIHLVRNPKGVAYSWSKKKLRPEIVHKKEYMPRYSLLRTAVSWNVVNLIASTFEKHAKVKYIRIFYENFVNNPKEYLTKIYKKLDITDNIPNFFIDEKTIFLKRNHLVSGNPMRFKTGEIILEKDEKWKENLSFVKKFFVDLITYPVQYKLSREYL